MHSWSRLHGKPCSAPPYGPEGPRRREKTIFLSCLTHSRTNPSGPCHHTDRVWPSFLAQQWCLAALIVSVTPRQAMARNAEWTRVPSLENLFLRPGARPQRTMHWTSSRKWLSVTDWLWLSGLWRAYPWASPPQWPWRAAFSKWAQRLQEHSRPKEPTERLMWLLIDKLS